MQSMPTDPLELKNMQRTVCGKCGKYFTNKKGVKQHMLRMHSSKSKKNSTGKTVAVDNINVDEHIPLIISETSSASLRCKVIFV